MAKEDIKIIIQIIFAHVNQKTFNLIKLLPVPETLVSLNSFVRNLQEIIARENAFNKLNLYQNRTQNNFNNQNSKIEQNVQDVKNLKPDCSFRKQNDS